MKFVEKNNEIILRDLPAQNWAQGVLFLFCFIIFGGALLIGSGKTAPPMSAGGQIFYVSIMLFALYWAYHKLTLPATVTRIKPNERIVEITTRRLLIIKKTEIFNFAQIERFQLIERKPDRAFLYFNVLILRNGSLIELESDGNAVEGTAKIVSVRLNEVLKKKPH